MQWITNKIKKAVPVIERAVMWTVRVAFEILKLSALAYMVMHLIAAAFFIEVVLASIVVFTSLYFTTLKR